MAALAEAAARGERPVARAPANLARDGAQPAPTTPALGADKRYTLTLSDGLYANITEERALGLLGGAEQSLRRAVDLDQGEWAEVNKGRLSFFGAIGGALTDLAGEEFPSYEATWRDAENAMIKARKEARGRNVEAAATQLREANAAYEKGRKVWLAYKAQLDDAGKKAETGVAVVAVLAVAVFVTGGLAAGALTPAAGGSAAAGGGALALGATVPVDAAAAGVAATVPVDAAAAGLATTVPAAAGGGTVATAAGATTVVGVGGATADAIVGAAIADTSAALTTGGTAAATATAEGMSANLLGAVYARLLPVLAANSPFTTAEAKALQQLADIIFEVWHRKDGGFPGVGGG